VRTLPALILISLAATGVLSTRSFAAESNTNRPFIAIWRDHERPAPGIESAAPYLRIAIWNDGRVLYSTDTTNRWSHNLRAGQISTNRVNDLKKSLAATAVFNLEGTTYLVPDAAHNCILLDLGDQQQMLYWDEVERPGYGININPQPHHLQFIRTWKEVNALALAAIPAESQPWTNRFDRPPASWRLKRPIQSR
jgi:hypothetical protein